MTEPSHAVAISRAEISRRVRALIVNLSREPIQTPAAASRLEADLNYDSLDRLELAVSIEQEFDLPPITDDDARDVETVGEIEDLLARILKAKD